VNKKPTHVPEEATKVTSILLELVSDIPASTESPSTRPEVRAKILARKAAVKAAAVSGALAAPPGPLGIATIIPDLIAIWHLQRQMVTDIAATFGKTGSLGSTTMIYCLFKHGGAALTRDLVVRVGERYLIRQATLRALQRILEKIGVRVTQRVIAKTLSRFVPLIGALGVGAYAYYDTTQVAATAIELFSSDLELDRQGPARTPLSSEA
jgi:hypothetical protein